MNKKKILLSTGIIVAPLVTALAVTINDFDRKPLEAEGDTAYSYIFEPSNSLLDLEFNNDKNYYEGSMTFARPNNSPFELYVIDAKRDNNELLSMYCDSNLRLVSPIWNIKSISIVYSGTTDIQISGYFVYKPDEENHRLGDEIMYYYYLNNANVVSSGYQSGEKFNFSALPAVYYEDNVPEGESQAVGQSFYPNHFMIWTDEPDYNLVIESITVYYDCH